MTPYTIPELSDHLPEFVAHLEHIASNSSFQRHMTSKTPGEMMAAWDRLLNDLKQLPRP
jgi:hypothetical protein